MGVARLPRIVPEDRSDIACFFSVCGRLMDILYEMPGAFGLEIAEL